MPICLKIGWSGGLGIEMGQGSAQPHLLFLRARTGLVTMTTLKYTLGALLISATLTIIGVLAAPADVHWLIILTVAAMTAFAALLIFKLRQADQANNAINDTMEQKVTERTVELLWSNSELQKSEQNNQALLHAMPDSMWRNDRDGFFLDFIPAHGDDAILPPDGWKGKTIFEVLPPHVAKRLIKLADITMRSGEIQIFDFLMSREDKVRHYECRISACGEAETLTIVRDITEIKQAEAGSQVIFEIIQGISTTSNLKELLDYIYHSISKFLYSENCYVALYNSTTGMLDLPLFIDKVDTAPPAVEMGRGLTSYVFRTGQPMLLTGENILQLVDDGEIELGGTPPAIWLGVPLRTPSGVIGILAVQHYEDGEVYDHRDLELLTSVGDQIAIAIERKRSDEALKASEARFQSAFDYAPIGIGLISPDGRWQQANRSLCEIVGYTKDELLKVTFSDIMHPDEVTAAEENLRQLFDGEAKTSQFEKKFLHRVGHEVLVLISVSMVRDSKNEPLYIIAQIQDVTERRSMEEKLQRGQKLESIGQLASGIAHEINTPTQYVGDNMRFLKNSFENINLVLAKNKQLLESCRTHNLSADIVAEMENAIAEADIDFLVDEVPKAFSQALDGIERVRKIVESVKDFAHPGSTDMKATDINKAIESTITVASNEWKYVADIITEYDDELPPVPCLVGEFNQVILNMIVNASHAIADVIGNGAAGKGTIRISTRRSGDNAEITISDTGTGMSERIRKKIFDPFFTTKDVGKGTGQGLAISHNIIVEKHKGTIDVESKVGSGTRFTVTVPLNQSFGSSDRIA